MQRLSRIVVPLALIVALGSIISIVRADPLPGEILKFQQLPLNGGLPLPAPYVGPYIAPNPFPLPPGGPGYPVPTAPFPGHDEPSTAYANLFDNSGANPVAVGWQGNFMADDFADRFTSPVVHVRWWGSYLNNEAGSHVKQFLISFESDVPASPTNPFSHPGTPLLNQIVTLGAIAPHSGTYTETPVPTAPGPDGALYQYNAELNLGKDFPQDPDTVYWLKIVALVDPNRDGPLIWGWHDRDWMVPDLEASIPPAVAPGEGPIGGIAGFGPVWHFQDDAVFGALTISPGPSPIMPIVSQDPLSFVPQHYIDGVDGPTGIGQYSKDLAFELYTVPEPAASLAMIGFAALFVARRRRNRD